MLGDTLLEPEGLPSGVRVTVMVADGDDEVLALEHTVGWDDMEERVLADGE